MESGRTGVMEGHPRASHSGGPPKSSRSPAPHRDASAEGPSSVQKPLGETAGAWTDHMRGPSRVQSLELEASIPKLVTHCPPDSPKPPSNLRPQYPSNSPQPIIETVSPNCPPDRCSVMRTNPGLYFVGAELPPRPQRPDSSTGFTAANEARVSPTSDPNGTDGSEPEGDEAAGDELRPGLRVHSDICPHSPPEEEYPELVIPLDEEEEQRRRRKKRPLVRRKRLQKEEEPVTCDVDQELDRALEDRAKQHNLTAVNVRNILHEVITNEHVVAMMKAAITETEGMPIFEPKMTRSKLKEVVEKGVVIPTWNLSPIKKSSKQQFVDIPLEEEDSSDEEYRPEEEDETAEESVHDSDVDSTASSPRGHKRLRIHQELQGEESMDGEQGLLGRHIRAESVPMGPPPPPKMRDIPDHAFMEKLHAVDEELECHPVTMDSFQSLDDSLIAFRTRSKRPLKNVPIGQLEAELRAPDITPDMYEPNIADDEDWKNWLCGLMRDDVGNEDEADDDDDPEYNILEDWDEPDTEDLRNDRAVRITKKEVNELMEELFETFQDEMGISHLEDEGADDEDSNVETLLDFNTPQTIRLEEPLLTEQHRTVRAQLEYLRLRKSLMTKTEEEKLPARESLSPPAPKLQPVMTLDAAQRKRLQQQLQQHIQLLTQLHLLTFRNPKLRTEADTAHMYLAELSTFADSSALTHSALTPGFQSEFWACNLKDALQLIPLVHSQVPEDTEPPKPLRKNVNNVPNLPKHTAWVLATRSVFMYPELLPVCAMKPRGPLDRVFFTKAEDNLLALGLKHFEGIEYSKQLTSKYLLTAKTAQQVTVRMKNLTMKKAPDNIIKFYKRSKMLPALSRCCEDILPQDARPPLEREKYRLPFWIKASLSSIEAEMRKSADSRYPLILPPAVSLTLKPLPRRFYQKSWRQRRSDLKPLLIRPNPVPKQAAKPPALQTVPITILGQVPPLVQPTVTMQGIVNLQPVSVPAGRRTQPGPCAAAAPTIVAQKARKPLIEAKTLAPTVTPILHSAPVVFAVPHGALKLVGVGTACGVLQLLSTESAVSVRTVLLNPNPAPLSQMPIQAPCTQTSQKTEDEEEWECVSITIKVEEGESSSATGAELPLEGRSQSDDVTEHVTPKIVEPDVTTEIPQSVPHQSLAASPGSKTEDPGEVEEPEEGNHAQNTEPAGDSPKNTSSSTTDGDVETNSPGGAQRDSSSPMDGQDLCNDKDIPEEEEDEDFDDLTQDEDDMSSEESVLSVPELQETMEKLTWLASERRLSQEGDSEDNSQEENTEPEEEEEEEGVDGSSHKPEEMTDEAGDEQLLSSHLRVPSPALVQTTMAPTAERRRGGSKGQSSHRGRNRRGRAPASKDASKLLLLYDEKILTKDPLREQKDMAYAQSYLTRVREALQSAPAIYQQFLNLIYEFETKGEGKTAVDLYVSLRLLLHDWPQLLKDFAAFLLPEQALECGLFEEQQAFDKSRRFLRQLEICFQENPAQHQKIIRLLQSSAECPVQETGKLKTQMWQLLKGHTHLQEEFSLFFQQLRPPPGRMQDFEVMTWSEDKEYAFDGFEEVTIPDVEEEEDKAAAPPRSKRRKDTCHGPEKDADWLDGGKECPCSCHEVGAEQRMKRCKRRMCAPCASKGCDSRSQRTTDVGATTVKDTGDSRLPLPKSTSSEARGPLDSSVSAQRLRAGADTGKARHQARGGSSRGGRKPHAVKSVVVQKAQQCSSPSEPNTPGLRSPPTTSSALCLNSAPEELSILQATAQEEEMTTVCAKNIKVSSSGEKVVVWTREADRVILTMCQEQGAHNNTFRAIAVQLDHKSPSEVAQRFRELINLFQTGCVTSSDDEEEEE